MNTRKPILLLLLVVSVLLGGRSFAQCFQIRSILVDACGGLEGFNESITFQTGGAPFNSASLIVSWPNNPWQGVAQSPATAALTASFNTAIAAAGGCGQVIEPPDGIIPSNATVVFFTSYNVDTTANSFGALNSTIYVLYQNNGTTSTGHFANVGTGIRTLTMINGACSDTVSYDRSLLPGGDGAAVNFTDANVASYVNDGCTIPTPPFTVDAGSPITACAGSTVSLTGTATAYVSVVWSAASGTFSNSSGLSTNYTIDPAASGNVILTLTATDACGNLISDTVSVTATSSITPNFATALTICSGNAVPVLSTTSPNGISGTWNPSTISNTVGGSYTFTPNAGQCALPVTLVVSVTAPITPNFATALTICSGNAVPILNATSPNGVSGTWNPSTISNTTGGSYIFTPNAGQCALPVTLVVSVTVPVTPDFATALTICSGNAVPVLSTTSPNGVSGTWNPSTISNTAGGSYTFTPNAGQCALPVTLVVSVTAPITPNFATALTICSGNAVPILNATSPNGISGTWNPSTISNTAGGSYTFTPNAGQCALPVTLVVSVTVPITPNFATALTICSGSAVPVLSTTSPNGISGTWNPSTISNTAGGSYTFTPNAGQCALPVTLVVSVTAPITPNFATALTICSGNAVPVLSTTSPNGISGTWNPSTISNTVGGSYTFTPNAGQCALPVTLVVSVTAPITPNFATALTICSGNAVPVLNAISPNGVSGTWNPSTISNTTGGSYTFTPNAGQCALPVTLVVSVTAPVTPNFATSLTICSGNAVPVLSTTSPNGISGTWNPATISNTAGGSYTFTPNAGQCALPVTLVVSVTAPATPNFATALTICSGSAVPVLSTTSPNGVSGAWNPSTISNTAGGSYTFTPNTGQCALPVTLVVSVTVPITPNFATTLTICSGSAVPVLSTTSPNGVSGTWNPSTISNTAGGSYTFTPNTGQCALPVTLLVTVNPQTVAVTGFSYATPVCADATALVPTFAPGFTTGGTFTSDAGLTINPLSGVVNPSTSTVGLHTIVYEVLASPANCRPQAFASFTITIDPVVTPALIGAQVICIGNSVVWTSSATGVWSSNNPTIATVDSSGTVTGISAGQTAISYSTTGNCPATVSRMITVTAPPAVNLNGGNLCIDNQTGQPLSTVNLNSGIAQSGHTFVWTLDGNPLPETGNFHVATVPGIYSLSVTNNVSGCSASDTAVVGVSSVPSATVVAGPDFGSHQSITVTVVQGSGNYEFQLDEGPWQPSGVFTNVSAGNHIVTVNEINGCGNLSLPVTLLNYPHFFTPNGDGFNDFWNIQGLQQPAELCIFDRYGKLIKQLHPNQSESKGWDGNYNGRPLPSSDYWFKLIYQDAQGNVKEFRAHFSLKR